MMESVFHLLILLYEQFLVKYFRMKGPLHNSSRSASDEDEEESDSDEESEFDADALEVESPSIMGSCRI